MKTLAIISALSLALLNMQGAHAAPKKKKSHHGNKYTVENLEKIAVKTIDCNQLMGLAKSKGLLLAGGEIVAAQPYHCNNLEVDIYDFYISRGAFVSTKNGICNVWSCEGILGGGHS